MKVKKLFQKGITLTVASAFLLPLCSCKEKEEIVSKEDAYAQLKSALTTTVETKELSVSIVGNFNSRTPSESEGSESADSTIFEESKGTIDISLQMNTDDENKITAQSFWLKLLDEKEKSLILESYYKNGNSYSYGNLFQESYSYTEGAEPDTFDPSDLGIEDFSASLDKILEVIPEAKSTVANGEYTLVWTANNDNLQQYIEAYLWIDSNESATEAQIKEQASTIAKNVTLGTTSLTVKIKDETITSISAVFDVTYEEACYNGECEFKMSVKDVTVSYPEDRLEEIKQKAATK